MYAILHTTIPLDYGKVPSHSRLNPRLDGQSPARPDIQTRTGGDLHVGVYAIQREPLAHFTGRKSNIALQNTVVGASRVHRVPLTAPPTHQARRRRDTIGGQELWIKNTQCD